MGIVTHCFVEVHYDANEWRRDHWCDLAEFDIGKCSSFRMALHEVGEHGWPVDASIADWQRDERFIDEGLQHVIGSNGLALAIEQEEIRNKQWLATDIAGGRTIDPKDRDTRTWPTIRALLAYVKALEAEGYKTRVLFWDS